jgi:hypothetical protein
MTREVPRQGDADLGATMKAVGIVSDEMSESASEAARDRKIASSQSGDQYQVDYDN